MAAREIITLIFSIVPLAAGAVSAAAAWTYLRGHLSSGIILTSIALSLLGGAHFFATSFAGSFDFLGEWTSETDRLLRLVGFLFLICGMVSAAKDVKRDRDALVVANDELRTSREELRLSDEELKERNRQLLDARALAARDGLTGILNRGSFQERVHEEIQRAEESHGTVGLVMVDIDDFKQTNDELGHLEGDRILQEVAAAITTLAPTDTTYRYGGDEFAILVRGVNDDAIAQLAENVRTEVADRLRDRCSATVSVGWTSFPTKASSANELIYGADAAMYEAKGAGKNRVIGSRATARSPENAIITAF